VNLWVAGVIVVAAVSAAVTVMFLIQRRAPVGGYFADSNRAAGVFGVLGTSFAVMLAFVIFLGFDSYGNARDKAGQEAVSVTELFDTAALFAAPARDDLRGQLICYARSVIHDEWPAMQKERGSPVTQGWVDGLSAGIEHLDIAGEKQAAAYEHWFAIDAARQEARRGRIAEASPFVPSPLWIILAIGALVSIGYVWLFADSRERFIVQAAMIGSVTVIVVASLLVVNFLDRPYENGSGSIVPVEMTRSLRIMEEYQGGPGPVGPPCSPLGLPTSR
jgi:hypothetical protein